jgi:hypothetical protein
MAEPPRDRITGLHECCGFFCLVDRDSITARKARAYYAFSDVLGNMAILAGKDQYSMFWDGRHYPKMAGDMVAVGERLSRWRAWVEKTYSQSPFPNLSAKELLGISARAPAKRKRPRVFQREHSEGG